MPRTTLALLTTATALLTAACGASAAVAPPTPTVRPAAAAVATPPPATVAPTESTAATSAASDAAPLSGTWSGQYSGSYNGTFTLTWQQSGTNLTGSIKLSNPPETLGINGRVQGSAISFGTVGSYGITYTGSVSGSSMSGSYQVAASGGGSWNASKTS